MCNTTNFATWSEQPHLPQHWNRFTNHISMLYKMLFYTNQIFCSIQFELWWRTIKIKETKIIIAPEYIYVKLLSQGSEELMYLQMKTSPWNIIKIFHSTGTKLYHILELITVFKIAAITKGLTIYKGGFYHLKRVPRAN